MGIAYTITDAGIEDTHSTCPAPGASPLDQRNTRKYENGAFMSYREIGEVPGCSRQTVMVIEKRALEKQRK